jgi:hypothetical protein
VPYACRPDLDAGPVVLCSESSGYKSVGQLGVAVLGTASTKKVSQITHGLYLASPLCCIRQAVRLTTFILPFTVQGSCVRRKQDPSGACYNAPKLWVSRVNGILEPA